MKIISYILLLFFIFNISYYAEETEKNEKKERLIFFHTDIVAYLFSYFPFAIEYRLNNFFMVSFKYTYRFDENTTKDTPPIDYQFKAHYISAALRFFPLNFKSKWKWHNTIGVRHESYNIFSALANSNISTYSPFFLTGLMFVSESSFFSIFGLGISYPYRYSVTYNNASGIYLEPRDYVNRLNYTFETGMGFSF